MQGKYSVEPKVCAHCGNLFSMRENEYPSYFHRRRCCSFACGSAFRASNLRQKARGLRPDAETVGEIPLNNGQVAIVDPEDWMRAKQYFWSTVKVGRNTYAHTHKNGKTLCLHSLIDNTPPGYVVDHIDGNGLNCRRANLRRCTQSQNCANKRKTLKRTSSRFKGVSRACWNHQRWVARIKKNGRQTTVGSFKTEEAAAKAYDEAARATFGEFARLNFPHPGEQGAIDAT